MRRELKQRKKYKNRFLAYKDNTYSKFMETKYVAIYRKGRPEPLAAIPEEMAEPIIKDFKPVTWKDYLIKPINIEEAKIIKQDIIRLREPEFDGILERIVAKIDL